MNSQKHNYLKIDRGKLQLYKRLRDKKGKYQLFKRLGDRKWGKLQALEWLRATLMPGNSKVDSNIKNKIVLIFVLDGSEKCTRKQVIVLEKTLGCTRKNYRR